MKCRTNEQRAEVQRLATARWAAHWQELKTDPNGFKRRRAGLPSVICVAYPKNRAGNNGNP